MPEAAQPAVAFCLASAWGVSLTSPPPQQQSRARHLGGSPTAASSDPRLSALPTGAEEKRRAGGKFRMRKAPQGRRPQGCPAISHPARSSSPGRSRSHRPHRPRGCGLTFPASPYTSHPSSSPRPPPAWPEHPPCPPHARQRPPPSRTPGREVAPLSPASSRSAAPRKSRAAAGAGRRQRSPLGRLRWPRPWPGGRWSVPPGRRRRPRPAPRGARPARSRPARPAAGSAPRRSRAARGRASRCRRASRCHPVLRLLGSCPACSHTLQLRQLWFPFLRPPWRQLVYKQRQQK